MVHSSAVLGRFTPIPLPLPFIFFLFTDLKNMDLGKSLKFFIPEAVKL